MERAFHVAGAPFSGREAAKLGLVLKSVPKGMFYAGGSEKGGRR